MVKLFQEKKIPMDIWLEFLGWYLSEGCVYYRKKPIAYFILIQQKSLEKERIIRNVLSRLGFHFWENKHKKGEQRHFEFVTNSSIPIC